MKLLDLFCGAGGAGMGYFRAGFDVTGVDIQPQPRYPFRFIQADALEYVAMFWPKFDAIHASPPCQAHSQLTPPAHRAKHRALIGPTRDLLIGIGLPFVIENVPSAKRLLRNTRMLCGSMFGLGIQRHRFFEYGGFADGDLLPPCAHLKAPVLISGTHRRTWEPRYEYSVQQCRDAADLQWMTRTDLDQAIPPAYTEYIGKQLLRQI